MVDIEGSKPVSRASIAFEKVNSEFYEISTSNDGISFDMLMVSKDNSINSDLELDLKSKVNKISKN